MTKYRIRLKNGRVIGPFIKSQLFELKAKGRIEGNEEAQIYPTGNWQPLNSFDIYEELMDENRTTIQTPSHEETFVIDLAKLRAQKNEVEIEKIDVTSHNPVQDLTETVRMTPTQVEAEIKKDQVSIDDLTDEVAANIEVEEDTDVGNKTLINPVAQQEIEALRKRHKEEEARLKALEEEKARLEEEKRKRAEEAAKPVVRDDSTQVIKLDHLNLLENAQAEEANIAKEAKEYKRKKKLEEASDDDDDEEQEDKGKSHKKKTLLIGVAVLCILYAFLFPGDEKPKKPPFEHLPPQIIFPIPFDKADSKLSIIKLENGKEAFARGTYKDIVGAGLLFKVSYENNIENYEALNLLVRSYAEQLKSSKQRLVDAQTLFNIIQSKRSSLSMNPHGVIGLNLFYMNIDKYDAAVDVVAKYLKINPKNVTPDLFAYYLKSLIKVGKVDLAKQFYSALVNAPDKQRYVLDALIDYELLNQDLEKAHEYIDDGMKKFPKLVDFYLRKADLLFKEKKFENIPPLLQKAEDLNLEYNDLYRAKYLEIRGLLLAYKGDVKNATELLQGSLKIKDSDELRMRLAELNGGNDPQNATDKLIAESKAIKLLLEAKEFYNKKSYELALNYAAQASDAQPDFVPSQLFLAKVQLKMGFAEEGLKTLEDLIKKYPDNKEINFALTEGYINTYKFYDAKNRIAIMGSTDLKQTADFASMNAQLYLKMNDSLQAISWLRNSINLNPLNDYDIYLLAELLIKRANFDAARVLLNKCIELDPMNADYRIAYSKIVYETQDDQAAVGYLLGLLDDFGESPKILSEIAIFYYRSGKVKDFQAYKEKIEKLPVKDKALYEFLIRAALLDERYNDIPGYVENLLTVEPGDLESMMTAGRILFQENKLVDAARWFKRVQDKLNTYPKVQYYIAKIKYMDKDLDGALAEVQKDMKANGENDADLVLMAQIYVDKNMLVEAENTYKKAQKLNSKNYEALVGLADISTKRNNFDLALDLYKKAMAEKSDEPIIHKKVGDVYRLLGQGTLAMESYKLYLDMYPEAPDKKQIEAYIKIMQ